MQRFLAKNPKKASIITLASEGDFFHQFKAVALIRLFLFPYAVLNYAFSITDVKYLPYFLGSRVGSIPDMVLSLYSEILLRRLAYDGTGEHLKLTTGQVTFEVVGIFANLVIAVIVTVYAKRTIHAKPKGKGNARTNGLVAAAQSAAFKNLDEPK